VTWWVWVTCGFGLLIFEMLTPGGPFALFIGIGALVTGVAVSLGLPPDWTQWTLFTVSSVASLIFLRGPLKARFNLKGSSRPVDSIVGTEAVLLEDVGQGQVGKAELRGTTWNARADGGRTLAKGQRCRVSRVEGLTLWLVPE
jgi:membrane protein implicated in regulation of membrane protease activity